MKKLICLVSVLIMIFSCMTACSFYNNVSGVGEAESEPKVEEMMQALSENNASYAKGLMHPKKRSDADAGIAQMIDLLAGRSVVSMNELNVNVSTSTGISGKSVSETASYRVTLRDGTVFAISTTYLTDNEGAGFFSFQLVMGVI